MYFVFVEDVKMKEEFKLSDKRKELYDIHKDVIPSAFMLLIKKQDKEFVKLLKEENERNFSNLLVSILFWFLSDNIKIDEKRLNRLFIAYSKGKEIDKLSGDLE